MDGFLLEGLRHQAARKLARLLFKTGHQGIGMRQHQLANGFLHMLLKHGRQTLHDALNHQGL